MIKIVNFGLYIQLDLQNRMLLEEGQGKIKLTITIINNNSLCCN